MASKLRYKRVEIRAFSQVLGRMADIFDKDGEREGAAGRSLVKERVACQLWELRAAAFSAF